MQNERNVASSNIPFPTLTDITPSAKTVSLLKDANFSKHSENSALSTYMFQHWSLSGDYENLKKSLEEIAIVEMSHLDALSNAIVLFGGKPNFSNSDGAYWSGNYVNQTTSPNEFLKQNIEAEKKAIRDYRNIQCQISNQSLISLIDKIIADELVHIQIFESYLNS